MRIVALLSFVALLWLASFAQRAQQEPAPPPYEHTFEASRRGALPVEYPGPFTFPDFVRLLVRRAGPFRLDVTRDLREWRLAPQADLWTTELPEVLKLRVAEGQLEVVRKPARLRLGVGVLYNLPVLIRNEASEAIDVKVIGTIGDEGPTDRFRARPGINYFSFNLRPRRKGQAAVALKLYAGMSLPEAGSPPESTVAQQVSFPVEVVGWGGLRLRTSLTARIYVVASDGLSYTPAGRLARITWSAGDYFYYGAGEDQIQLPAGPASIEAVRGFEYEPARQTVEIAEQKITDASLTLVRRDNLTAEGWYSGDVHIHGNYNNHEFITPEDVRDQVEAEDLNVANMMVANSDGPHVHDEQYFEGRPNRVSTALHIVYWVEEMRNSGLYGHMCLTGLKSLVKPLYTGFANSPYPYDYPPNYAQAVAAQKQGGAASYAHPGYEFTAEPRTMSARELPVDLALGSIDAMDVMSNANEDASTPMWYRLLNTGLKCAISAGTDSFTNRRHHWLPGAERVYVHVPGEVRGRLNYQSWIDNYKAGHSFATNGPILRLNVEGKEPGDELRLSKPGAVTITATASSYIPFDTLDLVANGKVIATARAEGDGRSARVTTSYKLDHSAWIAARARGPFQRLVVDDWFVFAHTSPVYCLVGEEKIGNREDAQFFVEWIDKLIAMAERQGRYANEEQKREVVELFRKGRAYYEGVGR